MGIYNSSWTCWSCSLRNTSSWARDQHREARHPPNGWDRMGDQSRMEITWNHLKFRITTLSYASGLCDQRWYNLIECCDGNQLQIRWTPKKYPIIDLSQDNITESENSVPSNTKKNPMLWKLQRSAFRQKTNRKKHRQFEQRTTIASRPCLGTASLRIKQR